MFKRSCVARVPTGSDQFQGGGMTILSRCHLTIFHRWDHPWAFRAWSSRRIENRPGANRARPLWAEFIFALDTWLRRREGVFEYSHKPDCILRAQLGRLTTDVLLSDGTFGRSGDRVIDLHFWNEQIPVKPVAGYWGMPLQPQRRKVPSRTSAISDEQAATLGHTHHPRDYKSRLASAHRRAPWIRGRSRPG